MKKQLRIFKTRVRDTLDHKQLEKQDQERGEEGNDTGQH